LFKADELKKTYRSGKFYQQVYITFGLCFISSNRAKHCQGFDSLGNDLCLVGMQHLHNLLAFHRA